jgi:signal transduction histidine kinase/ActR/RegA family two-component response regulator
MDVHSDRYRRHELMQRLDTEHLAQEVPAKFVARLATKLLATPMAMVTLITDTEQLNIGRVGIDQSHTALVDSFCCRTLETSKGLAIERASADPRVRHLPGVVEAPFIDSYATWPVMLEGLIVGSVCVFDTAPRKFDDEQLESLRDLAKTIETVLELRLKERDLSVALERSSDAAAAAGQWMWEANAEGRITWVSCHEQRDPLELCDKKADLLPDTHLLTWHGQPVQPPASLLDLIERGEPIESALVSVLLDDGSSRMIERSAVPVFKDGRLVLWRGIGRDVTQRAQTEKMALQSEAAQAALRAKGDFLAKVSHELRTPLNGLQGFLQLVVGERDVADRLSAKQRQRVALAIDASDQLLYLVNDLLEIASIEQGGKVLRADALDACIVIHGAKDVLDPIASKADITIDTTCVRGEHFVRADRHALRQVLTNLVSNAVKFGKPSGCVSVSVDRQDQSIRISVQDDGRGISEDNLKHLYEPFNRLGVGETIPGSGLGLVITKQLVDLMGGHLEIASTVGVGSTFTVVLAGCEAPQEIEQPKRSQLELVEAAPARSRKKVLYVEDNPLNAMLMREMLASEPLELTVVTSGKAALDRIQELAPDLVLLDMQLPDLSGLEIFDALKQKDLVPHAGCVILSADVMPDHITEALNLGISDYWTKPFNLPQIIAKLRALLADEPPPSSSPI